MYDNTAKIFWISFITSLLVSIVVVLISVIFVIPNVPFLSDAGKESKLEVPQLEGLNVERAKIIAMNKDMALFIESEKISNDVPKGNIIAQSPIAGAEVDKGTVINVVISAGPEIVEEMPPKEEKETVEIKRVTLPHYAGLNIDDVQRNIIELNLKIGDINYIENENYPKDAVVKTEPSSGMQIAEQSEIIIYVSKGAGEVTVPDVYRLSKSGAINKLQKAGLKLSQTHYTTDIEYPFDIVIRQSPKAGSKVSKDTGVEIWINTEM